MERITPSKWAPQQMAVLILISLKPSLTTPANKPVSRSLHFICQQIADTNLQTSACGSQQRHSRHRKLRSGLFVFSPIISGQTGLRPGPGHSRSQPSEGRVCSPQPSLCSPQPSLCSPHPSLCSPQSSICIPQSSSLAFISLQPSVLLCSPQPAFSIPQSPLCSPTSASSASRHLSCTQSSARST